MTRLALSRRQALRPTIAETDRFRFGKNFAVAVAPSFEIVLPSLEGLAIAVKG